LGQDKPPATPTTGWLVDGGAAVEHRLQLVLGLLRMQATPVDIQFTVEELEVISIPPESREVVLYTVALVAVAVEPALKARE
jgi:hypothetical protein